jgi:RES domain-containing protein
MRCFRIADGRFPLFDSTGARLHGGRWNSPGRGLIYAAETYAGAILEVLAHANIGKVPRTHAAIEIEIQQDLRVERLPAAELPQWRDADLMASRAFGDRWLAEARSAVLMVPSLVTQGRERNVLLNPAHEDFGKITYSAQEPVIWDARLFRA